MIVKQEQKFYLLHSIKHLPVQSQQKHLEKVKKMFKLNNNDTRLTLLMSFWCLHC